MTQFIWSDEDEAALSALLLADALDQGWSPPSAATTIALFDDEEYIQSTEFEWAEFAGSEVNVSTAYFVAFGSPLFLVASLGGSAAFNSVQRSRAQRLATPRWRAVSRGTLHITTRRFGLQSMAGWHDIVFSDVRAAVCMPDGVAIFLAGHSPYLLSVPWPEYLFVLFQFLAYGRVVRPDVDEELLQRAVALGKSVPVN